MKIDYSDNFYTGGAVRDDNKERQKKYQEMARGLSPVEKDRLAREKRELEDKVSGCMMSKDDLWPGDDQDKLTSNANKLLEIEQDPDYQRNVQRLRHVRQLLEPDNPNAKSVEYLRGSRYVSKGAEAHKLAKWS